MKYIFEVEELELDRETKMMIVDGSKGYRIVDKGNVHMLYVFDPTKELLDELVEKYQQIPIMSLK